MNTSLLIHESDMYSDYLWKIIVLGDIDYYLPSIAGWIRAGRPIDEIKEELVDNWADYRLSSEAKTVLEKLLEVLSETEK